MKVVRRVQLAVRRFAHKSTSSSSSSPSPLPPPKRIQLFKPHVRDSPTDHCVGCGWALQNTDPEQLGYLPPSAIAVAPEILMDPLSNDAVQETEEGAEEPRIICQRCHRIENHNEIILEAPNQSNKLSTLKERRGVVVLMADLTDIEGTLPEEFAKSVSGANPVILAGNKSDLLPEGATDYRLRSWLARAAAAKGLHPVGVHVTSSQTGEGIARLVMDVADRSYNFKHDVFICGRTNVGKSSMLNKMLRMYGGPKQRKTTVSGLHGTTVGLIPVPLGHDGGRHIYDTPGLLSASRVYNVLTKDELKVVQPAARLVPVVYRLVPGKSLFLGSFGRLDYVSGAGHLLFTTFLSKRLSKLVHATSLEKVSPGEHVLEPLEFEFDGDSSHHGWTAAWTDISWGGVGFVSITGRAPGAPIKLVAHSLAGVMAPQAREPLMPWEAAAAELKRKNRPIVKHGSVAAFRKRSKD